MAYRHETPAARSRDRATPGGCRHCEIPPCPHTAPHPASEPLASPHTRARPASDRLIAHKPAADCPRQTLLFLRVWARGLSDRGLRDGSGCGDRLLATAISLRPTNEPG